MNEITFDDLNQHSQWIQRLARSLVQDDATAEDLVQETWLTALRYPPDRSRPIRGWLAAVLRNRMRDRRRETSRRHARERRASRDVVSAGSSPAELTARVERTRMVADELLALDEPLREVLVLRFYEGMTSPQIAARLGVPDSTVRGRIKVGVERLRARLADRFQDERGEDWRPAMIALAQGLPATHAGSGLVWAAIALFVVVSAGVYVGVTRPGGAGGGGSEPVVSVAGSGDSPPPRLRREPTEPVRADVEVEVGVAADAKRPDDLIVVTARMLRPDGSPAARVAWRAAMWNVGPDGTTAVSDTTTREAKEGLTDENGRVRFEFDPLPHPGLSLLVLPDDLVAEAWDLTSLVGGDGRFELGDVTLDPGGSIIARVVDSLGQPFRGSVSADMTPPSPNGNGDIWVKGTYEPAASTLALQHVPAGRHRLSWRVDPALPQPSMEVEVVSGARSDVELVVQDVNTGRVSVRAHWSGAVTISPDARHVRLRGAAGPDRVSKPANRLVGVPGAPNWEYEFSEVPIGEYELVIDDPRFERTTRVGIRPDTPQIRMMLEGSAALAVVLTDESGAERSGIDVRLTLEGSEESSWIKPVVLHAPEDPWPEGGRFGGIPAGFSFRVRAETGGSEVSIDLGQLDRGEIRAVRAPLGEHVEAEPGRIRVKLQLHRDFLVDGVMVTPRPIDPSVMWDAPDSGVWRGTPLEPSGLAELGPLPPGDYQLRLQGPNVMLPPDPNGRSASLGVSVGRATLELGSCPVKGGRTIRQEFDLRHETTGPVEVPVRIDGAAAPGAIVVLSSLAKERWDDVAVAIADDQGTARPRLIRTGIYAVTVVDPARTFVWRHPDPLSAWSISGTTRVVSIDLVPGELRLVDEAGRPLADTEVRLRQVEQRRFAQSFTVPIRTDGDGWLRLRHPAGSLWISRVERVPNRLPDVVTGPEVETTWPPAASPVTVPDAGGR